MSLGFTVRGRNDTGPGDAHPMSSAEEVVNRRIEEHAGPVRFSREHHPLAPWRIHYLAHHRFFPRLQAAPANTLFTMEWKQFPEARCYFRVVQLESKGDEMLADAKGRFGLPYKLGGVPPGPADCTGVILFEYETYGNFVFPIHQSQSMFEYLGGRVDYPNLHVGSNERGAIFSNEGLCAPGDIVFKAWPNFIKPGDCPDHAGLWVRPGVMRDTRSVSERLYDRAIYDGVPGAQTLFGRVFSVNGRLP